MKKVHQTLLHLQPYDRLIEWSKTATLPGFGKLPLYTVFVFFFQEISRESIINKASSLAYNFMLAIFPGIIFLFTLIPYIPVNNFQEQLMELIQLALPNNAYEVLENTLKDIIIRQNGELLSVGFILCTFFATNGMTTLMMTFNKSSLAKESRTWFQRRIVALVLSFSIVIALVCGIFLYTGSNWLINYLKTHIDYDLSWFWSFLIKTAQWLILFSIYFFTVSLIYKFGPSSSRWKLFTPGATLATLLAMLSFSLFTFYINNFGAYNKLYGSIGTLIVVMIWMYMNALILIIGYELNASIALSKQSIKIVKPRVYNSFKADQG
ncbi:YihY family inner membrane protein [Sphingobacterium sp. DK4209]|uniref:YihY family inner membrane protein n=1 Tax=Sphingobacterium zhuxiongii TaxID=2662364 RepID=A0A5Q0QDM9_9SPHI|nr:MULTISPECIES: YihY/virulence factor BrkB family protein [unclassified Sphingobacterium]MVZ64283.1 YihY family inner membrane protein [Sphingobacterium sp. DK4209]QGA25632.1 YihY family inner membrane protein [Sphingobacterium sp. dk4302]